MRVFAIIGTKVANTSNLI